ncbi:MAG: FTR1 family protein [Tepidiformaceae bacterium]
MAFSFLVTLREGVEMALIVAILLGYLRSVGQKEHFREIWIGVGVAAVICLAVGIALEVASQELDKRVVEAFEGFAMIFAVVVLTGMAFWMRRQAGGISRELRSHVDSALNRGSMTALVLLAATSIGREGLETVLFLFAGSTTGSSGAQYWLGGALGFGVAAFIGVGIYHGTSRVPLKPFFMASGIVVIVLAAGLLANSVVKLYEAALITNLGNRPWDTEGYISITSTLGKFLSTLLGYDSAPSMLQLGLYWGYLLIALAIFIFMPLRRSAAPKSTGPGPGPIANRPPA